MSNRPGKLAAKPYEVWREQFLEDRCCTKEEIHKEFFISSVPHILLNVVLIIYWYIGAVVLHQIEPKLRYKSLHESALFCFITTSTIGWGNIVPATYYGKCFIILYIMIGTPLTYVVLGNNGQFLVDLYWILKKSYATKKKGEIYGGEMPLVISYGLLLLHICLGALLYSLWVDHKSFFESFYLTFISITTIGYGDEIPATDRRWEFYVTMLYLAIGVIIVTMVVGSMQGLFQRMHNLGRNGISGSQAVEIWFGGRAMRVGELVHIVAEHFSVEPAKLRHVLKDLDEILEAATAETESNDGDTSPLMEGHPEHQLTVTSLPKGIPPLVLLSRRRSEASALNAQLTVHSGQSLNFAQSLPMQGRIMEKSHSSNSLQRLLNPENENALLALRVINYKLQKSEVMRRKNSRQQEKRGSLQSEKGLIQLSVPPVRVSAPSTPQPSPKPRFMLPDI